VRVEPKRQHVIRNDWSTEADGALERAAVLRRDVHPEGLDIDRARALRACTIDLGRDEGRIVSCFAGGGLLQVDEGPGSERLRVAPGVHVYLPPGRAARIDAEAGTELVLVSAPAAQARGRELLVRDEAFLFACAAGGASLRWILTPQYLSRRVFLHHDQALVSRAGHPVAWFHTTMFDVAGLPPNADGESVFKMAYNSRTEINVCFDVEGDARVRMALHPYAQEGAAQAWGPWHRLDGDASYHLHESDGDGATEWIVEPATGARTCRRNKHEVLIRGGHVTLYCLFDPAPTGVEQHRPGEYSDYEPLDSVVARPEYARHRREIARFDAMVDRLSLARARGALEAPGGAAELATYREGHAVACAVEQRLHDALAAEGRGRDAVLARWMRPHPQVV
jgi:hypothetical protein